MFLTIWFTLSVNKLILNHFPNLTAQVYCSSLLFPCDSCSFKLVKCFFVLVIQFVSRLENFRTLSSLKWCLCSGKFLFGCFFKKFWKSGKNWKCGNFVLVQNVLLKPWVYLYIYLFSLSHSWKESSKWEGHCGYLWSSGLKGHFSPSNILCIPSDPRIVSSCFHSCLKSLAAYSDSC